MGCQVSQNIYNILKIKIIGVYVTCKWWFIKSHGSLYSHMVVYKVT